MWIGYVCLRATSDDQLGKEVSRVHRGRLGMVANDGIAYVGSAEWTALVGSRTAVGWTCFVVFALVLVGRCDSGNATTYMTLFESLKVDSTILLGCQESTHLLDINKGVCSRFQCAQHTRLLQSYSPPRNTWQQAVHASLHSVTGSRCVDAAFVAAWNSQTRSAVVINVTSIIPMLK